MWKAFYESSNYPVYEKIQTVEKYYLGKECGKAFDHLVIFKNIKGLTLGRKPMCVTNVGKSLPHTVIVKDIKEP